MASVIIMKKDLDRLAKYLLKEVFEFVNDEYFLNELKKDFDKVKKFMNDEEYILDLLRKNLNKEVKFEEFLKQAKDGIKDKCIDTEEIYRIIINFDLDMETHEDLYYKKEAFLDIYRVFVTSHSYLKD